MNKIITSRGIIDLTIPADAKTDSAGEYYMICPICTADRKHTHQSDRKLAINLRKDPMPWRCNHCGEGGYIINEEYMKNAKFKPVLKSFDYLPLSDGLTNWFWKKRGISIPTLEAFKISMTIEPMKQYHVPAGQEELKDTWLSQKCINFKYFKNNVLINIKYRDPNKNFKMITDATKTIYNIDSFKGKNKGIIVEGEIDVLSYYEAGLGKEYGIGSVPNGATITKAEKEYFDKTGVLEIKSEINLEYLDSVIDELSEIEIFYIATDDDAPGIKLREELARRLGKERCRYIRFSNFLDSNGKPIKDANELLVAKGPNVLASTIDSSIPFPIAGVSVANDFWDSLNNYYDTGRAKGISTGFPSLDPHFNWMKGWMYILNGFPNNGKTSVALNLIAISTVLYKWKWGIYCPENYPEENLIDMFAEILVGKSLDPGIVGRMSKIEYKAVVQEHISKYFYIVNDNDAGYSPADLRKIKKSLIKQYGITGFFTDPWSSLVHNYRSQDSEDKYLEHELSQEVRFTTKSGLINVISHHPKTPASVDKAPTVFSLTGGKVWWIKAYSIFAVHRKNLSDWQNLVTEFHVQKNKDFKAAGELTNDLTPPTFTYNRNNRRFYGQSPNDLQKHDFYPFKSYHETNQSVFEGF